MVVSGCDTGGHVPEEVLDRQKQMGPGADGRRGSGPGRANRSRFAPGAEAIPSHVADQHLDAAGSLVDGDNAFVAHQLSNITTIRATSPVRGASKPDIRSSSRIFLEICSWSRSRP